MNYVQLVAAISGYVENSFNTEDINNFITQAEQRIYNAVQFPALRKNVTGACSTTNKYLQCPADYLATYSIAVIDPTTGGYSFLLNKDVNFLREAYPLPTSTGTPKYYAIFGPRSDAETELAFILGPTPDQAYPVELHYFYYPTSITTAGTSWLGDNCDAVLLYGALVEAYVFMKGEQDMMQLYDTKFKEALLLAKRLGEGMEKQDTYRSGQSKTAVT